MSESPPLHEGGRAEGAEAGKVYAPMNVHARPW